MSVCNNQHSLSKTSYSTLRKSMSYRSGYVCKHCSSKFKNKHSFHCKTCSFDLCASCHIDSSSVKLKCSAASHTLTAFYSTHTGFECDICSSSQGKNELLYGCRQCDYDVCPACFKKEAKKGKRGRKRGSKKGKKSEAKKLWTSYADEEDPTMMSEEGMMHFFKDCGVNPESGDTLLIAYFLGSEEMGIVEQSEFEAKLQAANDSADKAKMKSAISQFVNQTNNDTKKFRAFYKWLFQHAKEDEKKRNIPTPLAAQLWQIIFGGSDKFRKSMKYLADWLQWVEIAKEKDLSVVSKDLWEQLFDFLNETKNIAQYYDEDAGWPVAIDEFVEWHKEEKSAK